jgi:hypothetical protein
MRGKTLANRLPGKAPVISGFVVPYIHIMARPVQGNTVRPEPGNSVKFRALVKKVTPGSVVKNPAQIIYADIVGPGNWHINTIYNIFPIGLVKIPIIHKLRIAHFFVP